ncbi:MAG: M28 family peptidase [Clostridia bacterium]|nr:M28 family peptidase [Clostridia bacterium]
MNKTKKFLNTIALLTVTILIFAFAVSCENIGLTPKEPETDEPSSSPLAFDYADECYEKIKYIDNVLRDRDCYSGANYKLAEKWILWNLYEAGYTTEEAYTQPFSTQGYFVEANLATSLSAVQSYEIADENHYKRNGRRYTVDDEGTYVKVDVTFNNIVAVKKGISDEQIIVGAHFDGTGTGDNGSGVALNLTTAQHIYNVETYYTIVFVFFNAEEIGCYGSTAFANALTDEEVAKTKYMINMDSLVCGDYCNLYGGVQDDETQTVNETEAYDNAVKVAETLGISFRTNPWTYENPAPGYDTPDYASPSTGDWSDHKGFKDRGIKYLYFEATNWEIPGPYNEYDGYGETYLIGMLMNTPNDYLEYIEKYFPGRIQSHLKKFSALLNALLLQSELDF